jgi:hypothetical protein
MILATWEAKIRRIKVQSQSRKKCSRDPISMEKPACDVACMLSQL